MAGPKAAPAILILGAASLATARRIQAACPGATVYGLAGRVSGADVAYENFGNTLRELYELDTPLIALCAAGIVIRALAPLLQNKRAEPPVLAVAEDGSAVVPLLGGLRGVNVLARQIAADLDVTPAITTTGELRFGTCLINPPEGYSLRNVSDGKTFISDLLAGKHARLEGEAPWLHEARIPIADDGNLQITVTETDRDAAANELLFHPRNIVVAVMDGAAATAEDLVARIGALLAQHRLAQASLACLVAAEASINAAPLHQSAAQLDLPLRFLAATGDAPALAREALKQQAAAAPTATYEASGLAAAVAAAPVDPAAIGRARGRLAVVGIGPGEIGHMAPLVKSELQQAQDVLGYETYVRMAADAIGGFRPGQKLHETDNREEMMRARHAFELAAQGRHVVMVSSGDPGVFAMAAAVVEALHDSADPAWHGVDLAILPGISAALAAASRAGAPLGHDFCILSLSDNLKPWDIIARRLDHAAAADLAMAFYNPISKARPHQLGEALDIIRRHRGPETQVVLGRDIGRPKESLRVVALGELTPEMVDMRTVVIVGSSLTRSFPKTGGGSWTYTPRWYGKKPEGESGA
ncbi:MAG TPA: precorrin-3B C(17)-methyltransferase [Dongiaceae bacterium]|nr:precorrin-3B C(17)-methyltransferase [Dongiaceae bacterium]